MSGKEIQAWSDPAMFTAQEIDENTGPTVTLMNCTKDPLGEIARVAMTYEGKFPASNAEITDEQRRYYFGEVRKNVLEAPLEFVTFSFLFTGVTRSFTHQLVRQRTAAFAQESMRFAVKDPMPTALPPSLIGTVHWEIWRAKCASELFPAKVGTILPTHGAEQHLIDKHAQQTASKEQLWRREWDNAIEEIGASYNALISAGMPAEDARGLAPHATLTQVNYHTSLRHLKDHAGLRLCSQAQAEWKAVWVGILKALRDCGKGTSTHWQYNEIADLFKPVCYQKGSCQFMADGDRYCQIRETVQGYAELGIPSRDWHIDLQAMYDNPDAAKPPRVGGDWAEGGQGPKA
jgi:thymidylate synthase ThyX